MAARMPAPTDAIAVVVLVGLLVAWWRDWRRSEPREEDVDGE